MVDDLVGDLVCNRLLQLLFLLDFVGEEVEDVELGVLRLFSVDAHLEQLFEHVLPLISLVIFDLFPIVEDLDGIFLSLEQLGGVVQDVLLLLFLSLRLLFSLSVCIVIPLLTLFLLLSWLFWLWLRGIRLTSDHPVQCLEAKSPL